MLVHWQAIFLKGSNPLLQDLAVRQSDYPSFRDLTRHLMCCSSCLTCCASRARQQLN